MLRPGFPRLSHAGVAHAIPSIAFIGPVYRRARLLVFPTIFGVQLTDQQRPTQAPRARWGIHYPTLSETMRRPVTPKQRLTP